VVLPVRGSTGSLGKLTLQRDCGVSWRYQGTHRATFRSDRERLLPENAVVFTDFQWVTFHMDE
jgi:hypothetical protein